MKKIICIMIIICLGGFCFVGCTNENKGEIHVYTPDGATAISLAYIMKNVKTINGKTVKYHIVPAAAIGGYVADKSADIAIMPTNGAATLYAQGTEIKLAAAVTHGNLFVLGSEITSLTKLEGKNVACMGQGQVPDMVFKWLLKQNDLENKVNITYYQNGTAASSALAADPSLDFAVVPQPDAGRAIDAHSFFAFDLQAEWERITGYAGYPQAGLVVKSTLEASTINAFLAEMVHGDGWAEQNPLEVSQILAQCGSMTITEGSLTANQIKGSNIRTQTENLQEYIENYFEKININSPQQGFYFAE